MTINDWAARAGRLEGERNALLDAIEMAIETLQNKLDPDPDFARIVLESIVLAVRERDNAANDNLPKARA